MHLFGFRSLVILEGGLSSLTYEIDFKKCSFKQLKRKKPKLLQESASLGLLEPTADYRNQH